MADPFKTYRTGTGKTISALLANYGEKAAASLGRALYLEGQRIINESKPLVPVDTGALRASGYVEPPVTQGRVITVTLGYGGPAAQVNPKSGESTEGYAIYVHENLEAHHPVGQAKFLEQPFLAAEQGMSNRIASVMRRDLETPGAA